MVARQCRCSVWSHEERMHLAASGCSACLHTGDCRHSAQWRLPATAGDISPCPPARVSVTASSPMEWQHIRYCAEVAGGCCYREFPSSNLLTLCACSSKANRAGYEAQVSDANHTLCCVFELFNAAPSTGNNYAWSSRYPCLGASRVAQQAQHACQCSSADVQCR